MTRATKIQSPLLPSWSIPRPSLQTRLDESRERRLTTIVAGAGFGKSTVLARWSSEAGSAWYTIDERDDDLGTFARGLVGAIRRRVPDLPEDLAGAFGLRPRVHPEDRTRTEAMAAHLSEALEAQLDSDLALVLDDVHVLERSGPSTRLIEGLCRHAPPTFHLLLASRTEIPFPIERLRGRGEVLSIEPAILAFSTDEVKEVLRAALEEDLSDWAEHLHEMTGGWPVAVRLAIEAFRGRGSQGDPDALTKLRRPGGPLFTYLAEEVFAHESADVRDLLRRTVPFDRFGVGLCQAVGVERAEATLADLVRRGLFIQPQADQDGEWYSAHALVREFVVRNWPLEAEEAQNIHREAVTWFELHGHLREALRALTGVASPSGIARMLRDRGDEILAHGAVDELLRLAELIPPPLRDAQLEELFGEAYTVHGETTRAEECFRRAADGLEELPPSLAWRVGQLHQARGEHEQALHVYARGRIDGSRLREEAWLLAATASALVMTGDLEASRPLSERALAAAEASGDSQALAAAHAAIMLLTSGREPSVSEVHYRYALEWASRAGDVLLSVRIRTNRASHLDDEGQYEEALAELEIAIREAELAGYAERLALALNNRGWTRYHLGRLEEAIADLDRSREIFQGHGSSHACWPLRKLGAIYRERGDLSLARTVCEQALELAERSTDVQGLIGAQAELARILAIEEPDHARQLADRAVAAGRSWGGLVTALVTAGWVGLARGDLEGAADLGREAAEEARKRSLRPGLAEALELQALSSTEPTRAGVLLEEATALWREIGNPLGEARAELASARLSAAPDALTRAARAERRLQMMGVRAAAAAGAAGILCAMPQGRRPPVEVRTLGGFLLLRGGQPVPPSEWQSKKARDLLRILLARRGRPTPRELLMEALWPGEDPEPLANRLSVALARARTVLDPDRERASDHFIGGDATAVWLELDNLSVDVEVFFAEASAGMTLLDQGRDWEARELLDAAEAKYPGDFLEEDLYEEWTTGLREEARALYVSVARALARIARQTLDHDAAVRYLLRILQRDPHDEEAHLGLVSALSAAGRHGEARRSYGFYVARMEELGVEPAPMPLPNVP